MYPGEARTTSSLHRILDSALRFGDSISFDYEEPAINGNVKGGISAERRRQGIIIKIASDAFQPHFESHFENAELNPMVS